MLQNANRISIVSQSVTIDVTPLSKYKAGEQDIAKITANLLLEQALPQETTFVMPNVDGIKMPKVYLPDGRLAEVGDFDPTAVQEIEQLPAAIQELINKFTAEPSEESMNNAVNLMADLLEYKNASSKMVIPAGTTYITFSFAKKVQFNSQTSLYELETSIPFNSFTFRNAGLAKANVIVLMPLEIQDPNNVVEAWWKAPNGEQQNLDKQMQAGRILLSKYWQQDPVVSIKYKY